MPKRLAVLLLAAAVAAVALPAGRADAQQPAPPAGQQIKRTPLQKFEVPGTNYETIIGLAEIAPGVAIGRHSHPGVESGYVLEGEVTLMVEGQPDKTMKPGESYTVPAKAVHDARAGASGGKVIATYVVEKGFPFSLPAAPK